MPTIPFLSTANTAWIGNYLLFNECSTFKSITDVIKAQTAYMDTLFFSHQTDRTRTRVLVFLAATFSHFPD